MQDWYELKFSYAFRTKVASDFQDFFTSIMERGYITDFQKVKPYGNKGDKKCDGYQESLKRVFQVYAPEKMQAGETNKKIDEDFTGAIEHWTERMTSWVFVHNQWRGIPPDVLQKLLDIHGTNAIDVLRWCEPELRNEFFRLSPDNQALLLGPAPTAQSIARIQMKDVIQVVSLIAQQETPPPEEIAQVPAGKLKANSLSTSVQSLLTMGSRKSRLVKRLFTEWHDPELGDRIAKAFRSRYEELRSEANTPDNVFFELWKFAGGGSQKSIEYETAVLAVLSFLFEECDIFEAPRPGEIN